MFFLDKEGAKVVVKAVGGAAGGRGAEAGMANEVARVTEKQEEEAVADYEIEGGLGSG